MNKKQILWERTKNQFKPPQLKENAKGLAVLTAVATGIVGTIYLAQVSELFAFALFIIGVGVVLNVIGFALGNLLEKHY